MHAFALNPEMQKRLIVFIHMTEFNQEWIVDFGKHKTAMNTNRPKIFITQPIPEAALQLLEEHALVELNPDATHIPDKNELLAAVKKNDYLFCLISDRVDAEVIQANPGLKMIASMAITPTEIDVEEATARKIPVTTIPAMVTEATADLAWGLILGVSRNIVRGDKELRSGVFPGGQSMHLMGSGVTGKTLGIVGFGRIGEAMAKRAGGFDMKVLYHNRTKVSPEREKPLKAQSVSLEELLRQSDFVSINVEYNRETHHLIGESELEIMQPCAYLINTSRGAVVDEKALAEALGNGSIAGAGLDVFENEPHIHPGLIGMDNTVLTPHLGSAVEDIRTEMATIVARNIIAVIEGRRPPNLYNPMIYS